jgi:HEPN domain-containing protein
MDQEAIITYWKESAKQDFETAVALYESSRYHHSLFFWHLALEKILKSQVTAKGEQSPRTHDLGVLAKLAGIELSATDQEHIDEINTFNLEGRYDDYHFSFFKKATKEYTDKWTAICRDYFHKFQSNGQE